MPEQRALLAAVRHFLEVVGAVLAAQHVAARAADDLVHHARELVRRLVDQHAGREHEIERGIVERERAGARLARVDVRDARAQDLQRALVDVHSGDVAGAEQLGQPLDVRADVAADLQRGADLDLLQPRLPERPPALARGAVAHDVVVAELARPQRFEARCVVCVLGHDLVAILCAYRWRRYHCRDDDPTPALLHALRVPPAAAAAATFDDEGVCTGCRVNDQKARIDWTERREELREIVEEYRSKDGSNYDCLIPVSGGKDSTTRRT